MAVYFEPQRQQDSWADGMNRALQIGLQYQMQNQMMKNRNELQQGNMDKRAELNDTSYQNRLDMNQKSQQGMLDKTFGANIQNAGRGGKGSIQIDGQMNPNNTGMSQETLNQMKMQAQTGVNPNTYKPKVQKPLGYSMNTKDGQTTVLNKDTGKTSKTGTYKSDSESKGTSPKQKRLVALQKNINAMNQKKTSIMAGENIYDSVTGSQEKALGNLEGDMMEAIYELHTTYPEAYKQMYPKLEIRTGVDKKTGKKVIQFPDGTIKYAD